MVEKVKFEEKKLSIPDFLYFNFAFVINCFFLVHLYSLIFGLFKIIILIYTLVFFMDLYYSQRHTIFYALNIILASIILLSFSWINFEDITIYIICSLIIFSNIFFMIKVYYF